VTKLTVDRGDRRGNLLGAAAAPMMYDLAWLAKIKSARND